MDIFEFKSLPHRFRWGGMGGDDCMTFPARWAEEVTGIDPAEELRGTYRTREEAHAILDRFGGPLAFMDLHLSRIGARRVQQPQDGDIGLIRSQTFEAGTAIDAELGAVRFGPVWLCIQPGGIRSVLASHIACWRLTQ